MPEMRMARRVRPLRLPPPPGAQSRTAEDEGALAGSSAGATSCPSPAGAAAPSAATLCRACRGSRGKLSPPPGRAVDGQPDVSATPREETSGAPGIVSMPVIDPKGTGVFRGRNEGGLLMKKS